MHIMVVLFLLHKQLIHQHPQKQLIINYVVVIGNRNQLTVKTHIMMVHPCEVGAKVTHHKCDT